MSHTSDVGSMDGFMDVEDEPVAHDVAGDIRLPPMKLNYNPQPSLGFTNGTKFEFDRVLLEKVARKNYAWGAWESKVAMGATFASMIESEFITGTYGMVSIPIINKQVKALGTGIWKTSSYVRGHRAQFKKAKEKTGGYLQDICKLHMGFCGPQVQHSPQPEAPQNSMFHPWSSASPSAAAVPANRFDIGDNHNSSAFVPHL
ncbi:hypothetical protein HAX54_027657 [Datura stramonium]|uniref:Uncharacterized protein n=1 Tax=Datura stramonium TaxID=4076 RepID=A0ABS8V380_DATST|nr:hypothetical protein [Datura stramonium]